MKQTQSDSRKFGFYAMFTMIVGSVIGSGIFVKNEAIFELTESSILSIVAWATIGFMMLMLVVNFIEIASSTSKTGEGGTISNWGTKFIGPKTGRAFGVIFSYIYFPILIGVISLYGAQTILSIFEQVGLFSVETIGMEWVSWTIITFIAVGIIGGAFLMNSTSTKASKTFQMWGTTLAMVPLVFLVLTVGTVAVINWAGGTTHSGLGGIADNNVGMEDGVGNSIKVIFLAAPAVLFSFAGIVLPASLQGETKSPSTFKKAFISGTLFIVAIYLLFSIAIFATFDGQEGSLTLAAAINNLFSAQTAAWLGPLMTGFVVMAIFSTISGFTVIAIRSNSELSATDSIADKNSKYLIRNKQGVPSASGKALLLVTIAWFMLFRTFDAIILHEMSMSGQAAISDLASTNYMADIATMAAVIPFAMLLAGSVINRWTKKVEVEKQKMTIPFGIIGATFIGLVSVMMGYDIVKGFTESPELLSSVILNALVIVIMITTIASLNYKVGLDLDAMTAKDFKSKLFFKKAYLAILTPQEYQAQLDKEAKKKTSTKKPVAKKKATTKKVVAKKKPVAKKKTSTKKPVAKKTVVKKKTTTKPVVKKKPVTKTVVKKKTTTKPVVKKKPVAKKAPAKKKTTTKK